MTDYKPERGERAVFYGSAVGNIEVYVADYRGHFTRVGICQTGSPFLLWNPYMDHKANDLRLLDPDTQAWSWETLMEAKRRHEAGEPLGPLATHDLVPNETNSGMHLAPTEEASCSPLF